jgi:acyl-CoA synthetase (AMP-forming)/AMP-acid ligase II
MAQEFNIGIHLVRAARKHADRVAFVTVDESTTYSQFEGVIGTIATEFKGRGVRRGSCIAIDTRDGRLAIAAVAACGLLGASFVQGNPASYGKAALDITHVFWSGLPGDKKPEHPNLIPVTPDFFSRYKLQSWLERLAPKGYLAGRDTFRIGMSSGSTGLPKFISMSVADSCDRCLHWADILEKSELTTMACLFPPLSGVGLNVRVATLLSGGKIVETGLANELRPWTDNGVNFVVGSPGQVADLFPLMDKTGMGKIENVYMGGGRLGALFLEKVMTHFNVARNFYGSTELGNTASAFITDAKSYHGQLHKSRDGVRIEVVDENDDPVPQGQEGIVRTRHAVHQVEYIATTGDEAASFRNGWFYPGDIGYFEEDGAINIVGRSNEVINLGGVKINSLEVDDKIKNFPGVKDGYCFTTEGADGVPKIQIAISVEDDQDGVAVAQALIDLSARSFLTTHHSTGAYVLPDLPRTDTGKPQRSVVAEMVAGKAPTATRKLHS